MTIRQATPLIAACMLCLSHAATAQQAPEPAPVRLALVSIGAVSPAALAAIEAVLADSPRIARVAATAPPGEDSDAARARWLREGALEAALLATQDGDILTLTAIGPTGEVLGASRAPTQEVSARPDIAQQTTQRAVGILGQPVLRWRQANPDEAKTRSAPPAATAPTSSTPEDKIRVGLALRLVPMKLNYNLPADPGRGLLARERDFEHKLVGLVTSLEPLQPEGTLLGQDNLWFDIDLLLGLDLADIFTFSSSILFGGIVRDGEFMDVSVCGGMRSRLHLADADADADLVLIQLDLLGAAVRWQIAAGALSVRFMITSGFLTMPVPGAFGFSITSQLDLRFSLVSRLYGELRTETSAAWGFGYEEEPRTLDWAMASVGVGWWF